jgi:serine/threonine protein kinase
MLCPNQPFLEFFATNPDAALADLPEFDAHLENCRECQNALDAIALQTPSISSSLVFPSKSGLRNPSGLPVVPGYDVLERIGSGGFGTVYQGTHCASGRPVAIKFVQSITPSHWKRIVLERETLVQCDHPNIISLLDFGQGEGRGYFVYPWMPQTVAKEIAKTPVLDLELIISWLRQMTEAIEYLHERGIVHRDLKPSNVLLSHSGRPKIADFGIAKDISESAELLSTGGVIGTPGFMAPEQTGMTRSKVSVATDIYGLGAILYQLLTGRPPFTGADPSLLLEQIVNSKPIGPKKLRSDVPRDLEMICLKCLEKEPEDRYPTAKALREDLDRFTAGLPILARALPVWKRIYRSTARHPLVSSLICVIAALVIVGCLTVYRIDQQAKERQQQLMAFELANQIGIASPDRIPDLLRKASVIDSELLDKAISEIAISTHDPIARLRWTTVHTQLKPDWGLSLEETVNAIGSMQLQELSVLSSYNWTRLFESGLSVERLQSELVEARGDRNLLNLAVCVAQLSPEWDGMKIASQRIHGALQSRPASEGVIWANLLENIQSPLLDAYYDKPATEIMTEIAWQWSKNEVESLVRIVPKLPVSQLSRLRSLDSTIATNLVTRLKMEESLSRAKLSRKPPPKVITQGLQRFLEKHEGFVIEGRGIVLAIPVADSTEFLSALSDNQMALRTISTFDRGSTPYFAATFEQSNEPCRVEWELDLGEVPTKMKNLREQGWEAVCFALSQDRSSEKVSMLWRKGDWLTSEWLKGSEVLESAAGSILDDDTNELDLQLQTQAFTDTVNDWIVFGLRTKRKINPRDESKRRMLTMHNIDPIGDSQVHCDRSLEIIPEVDRYLQLSTNADVHLKQSGMLTDLGYQPVEAIVDTYQNSLRIRSFWKLASVPSSLDETAKRASVLIALWMLGEPVELLDGLQDVRDPSLKTQIAESLGRAESDIELMLTQLSKDLSTQQLHGMLLCLMDWSPEQFEFRSDEWKATLQRLWEHSDSGIHFAADHLLRMFFKEESRSIVRPDLCLTHNLESQSAKGYNWYYGPFGLPFAIIDSREMVLVGSDERIPWHVGIDRRVCKADRKFAICSIETPLWLIKKFREDTKLEFHDRNWIGNDTADSPVVGCGLSKMLQACRWLSELENLDLDTINLPSMTEIGNGLTLPEDFLKRDGYRLPSNLEWEIACRGGSWGPSFLGESAEFLGEYAWNASNSENAPSKVARLKPNPIGLFDIMGNVHEAVLGESMTSGDSPGWDRWQLKDKTILNIRGGSYLANRIYCTSGSNHHIYANSTDINAGFRIVRPLRESE